MRGPVRARYAEAAKRHGPSSRLADPPYGLAELPELRRLVVEGEG